MKQWLNFHRHYYYVPNCLKMQEMCDEAVHNNPAVLYLVPDRFKTKDMCTRPLR